MNKKKTNCNWFLISDLYKILNFGGKEMEMNSFPSFGWQRNEKGGELNSQRNGSFVICGEIISTVFGVEIISQLWEFTWAEKIYIFNLLFTMIYYYYYLFIIFFLQNTQRWSQSQS